MPKLLASLLVLTLAACATQLGTRNSTDQRLTMFSQIVFATDYDSRRTDFLAKWTGPLHITLKGDGAESQKGAVGAQATALANLTGMEIGVVSDSKPSNVTVFVDTVDKLPALAGAKVGNAEELRNKLLATGCHSYFEKDAGHRITGAAVFIRTGDDVTTVRRCIAEKLTRILGLANESDLIQPSIFNTNNQLLQLTTLDLKIVRALAAPQLKPGMARREALAAVQGYLQ